jgi:hypothetical protein
MRLGSRVLLALLFTKRAAGVMHVLAMLLQYEAPVSLLALRSPLSRGSLFKLSSKFAAKCQLGVYLSNDVVICVAMWLLLE